MNDIKVLQGKHIRQDGENPLEIEVLVLTSKANGRPRHTPNRPTPASGLWSHSSDDNKLPLIYTPSQSGPSLEMPAFSLGALLSGLGDQCP